MKKVADPQQVTNCCEPSVDAVVQANIRGVASDAIPRPLRFSYGDLICP